MARSKQHSPFFELAKAKYEAGLWTIKMLRTLVAAGKITAMPMDIPDPYGGTLADYTACLAQLRVCLSIAFAGEGT